MTVRRMQSTNTHSECVILLAFKLQHASMFCYIACLVMSYRVKFNVPYSD